MTTATFGGTAVQGNADGNAGFPKERSAGYVVAQPIHAVRLKELVDHLPSNLGNLDVVVVLQR